MQNFCNRRFYDKHEREEINMFIEHLNNIKNFLNEKDISKTLNQEKDEMQYTENTANS